MDRIEKMGKILFFLKERKVCIFCIVLWGLISCSMFLAYRTEWTIAMNQPRAVVQRGAIDELSETEKISLSEESVLIQEMQDAPTSITGISLYLDARDVDENGQLFVSLSSKSNILQSWQFDLGTKREIGFYDFMLDKEVNLEKNEKLEICIKVANLNESELYIYLAEDKDQVVECELNESLLEGKFIPYKLFEGTYSFLKYFAIFLYIAMTGILFLACFLLVKKIKIEVMFSCIALIVGLVYMFILPPYVVPDEPSHFVTAYAQSSKLLGQTPYDEDGKIIVSSQKLWGSTAEQKKVSKDAYVQFAEGVLGYSKDKTEIVSTREALSTQHPGYIPQILGITVARLMKMNSDQLLFTGRFFALLWYCFIMYWAIKIMPIKKIMLFIVGLLPMTMQQVVSYNYDSFLFGICFFTISYLLNFIYKERSVKAYDWIIILALTFSIASIKFVYLPILGIALFIPKSRFKRGRSKTIGAIGMVIFAVAVTFQTRLLSYLGAVSVEATTDSTRISLDYCMHNPFTVAGIFYRTLERQMPRFIAEIVATSLGWLDIALPVTIVIALIFLLCISMIQEENETDSLKLPLRFYMLCSTVAMIFLIMVVLFLDWTPLGSTQIEGLQGRYFLPFLPLMLLILQNRNITIKKNINQYLIMSLCYVQCLVIFFVSLIGIGQ